MTAAAALAAGLLIGFMLGAVAVLRFHRIDGRIAANTRAAFLDDAAELAIDDDAQAEVLS